MRQTIQSPSTCASGTGRSIGGGMGTPGQGVVRNRGSMYALTRITLEVRTPAAHTTKTYDFVPLTFGIPVARITLLIQQKRQGFPG